MNQTRYFILQQLLRDLLTIRALEVQKKRSNEEQNRLDAMQKYFYRRLQLFSCTILEGIIPDHFTLALEHLQNNNHDSINLL
jgi:hypothetical protein